MEPELVTAEPLPLATDESCDPDSLAPLIPHSPANDAVLDQLQPTIRWSNPNNCIPLANKIVISDDPGMNETRVGYIHGQLQNWQIETPLDGASQYWWQVFPLISTDSSPDDGGNIELGPPTPVQTFSTGPLCSVDELDAPILLEPVEGDVVPPRKTVSTEAPILDWDFFGACLPDTFEVILSTHPEAAPPVVVTHHTLDTRSQWKVDFDLEENTQYYWKVAAVREDTRSPFSQVHSFMTGEIDEDLPGVISGRIWDDECDNPPDRTHKPEDSPVPDGCRNVEGYIIGNGEMERGEQALPDLTVVIADGECPSAETPRILKTDENGFYHIFLLTGTYCIHIDPNSPENRGLLQPGVWSYPVLSNQVNVTIEIESPGQILDAYDFGWDFDGSGPQLVGGVSGNVWDDLNADGTIQHNEPGIEGLELWLFQDGCAPGLPASDTQVVSTTRTDADGMFGLGSAESDAAEWGVLEAGSYCVMVDPDDHEYDTILDRGSWTQPAFGDELPAITFELSEGEHRTDVDFGWHYPPYLIADTNVNCRYGPGTVYHAVGYINEGIRAWVEGHNPNTTWLGVRLGDSPCWVSDSVVTLYGDPEESPLWPIPEPPDRTPPEVQVSHSPAVPTIDDTVSFSVSADDDRGVDRIMIRVKAPGSGSFTTVKECSDSTSCSYTGGPYDEGEGKYYAIVWDDAGNKKQSATKTFDVLDPYL
jgi:hypothetical protein